MSRAACAFLLVAASLEGCRKVEPIAPADAGVCTCPSAVASRPEPAIDAPHVTPLATCDAQGRLPLEAARAFFDEGHYEAALSCAAQASANLPNDVLAHTERANALAALKRSDEAKVAYARALALQPDSLEALLGAAHFYTVVAPAGREYDELGLLYAERGFELALADHDTDAALEFARVSAMAFNDMGRSAEALERAGFVLKKSPQDPTALYEKAMALFEQCHFAEAQRLFTGLSADPEHAAHAHHHLGLILEREGDDAGAQSHFSKASELDSEAFPAAVLMSVDEFKAEVKGAVAALPEDMRRDLVGVPVATEDLPALDDLTANEPPLSPTILGLFRGPPLSESCEADAGAGVPCRSIALYRKNLARAVRTADELREQVRVTLLHEVGHLRGEDDGELAARGLE